MFKKAWLLPIFTITLIIISFLIFRSVLTFLAISAVFSLIAMPLYVRLKRIKIKSFSVSSGLAAILSIITFYGLIILFLATFIPSVAKETQIITKINPLELISSLEVPINKIEVLISSFTGDKISIQTYLIDKLTSVINISVISKWVNLFTSLTGDLFISFFAISFITFFFMKDAALITKSIYAIIPKTLRDETNDVIAQIKTKLTRYFVGICIEVFLVFVFNAIGLWFIGVDSFLVIALFAGIINVIPYVGPLIGTIFGCLIVLTTNYQIPFTTELLPLIGYTSLVMIVTQLLDNIVLQPIIYSNSVNAHPLEIFLVILIAGNSYGILGMIVAIPLYSVIRVIIKEIRDNSKFLNDIYINEE
jgi:predicted PurR-regulated permease PerM